MKRNHLLTIICLISGLLAIIVSLGFDRQVGMPSYYLYLMSLSVWIISGVILLIITILDGMQIRNRIPSHIEQLQKIDACKEAIEFVKEFGWKSAWGINTDFSWYIYLIDQENTILSRSFILQAMPIVSKLPGVEEYKDYISQIDNLLSYPDKYITTKAMSLLFMYTVQNWVTDRLFDSDLESREAEIKLCSLYRDYYSASHGERQLFRLYQATIK